MKSQPPFIYCKNLIQSFDFNQKNVGFISGCPKAGAYLKQKRGLTNSNKFSYNVEGFYV